MTERVVIVGGGIAGVSTAASLRSGGFQGEITIVDSNELPYDRPPLSKGYLLGTQNLVQILLQPPGWYDEQRVRLINRTAVTALLPREGKVELDDGTQLAADRVVLATGGGAVRPPVPGLGSDRVHVLRSVEDADRLRPALVPGARVLVVGAGLIGAEVASTAVDAGCEVTLIDPVAAPLVSTLGHELAGWLHDLHARHGVTSAQAAVASVTEHGNRLEVRLCDGSEPRAYDAVVFGVGMVPRIELAVRAGLEVERGVLVDAGQVTSNVAVLAVGDPAHVRGGTHAGHWEAARQDGARAAATILGTPVPERTAPWFWTDRYGRHVEGVGQMEQAERTVLRGAYDAPSFCLFGLRDGFVVAAAAVDDSAAVRAARRLIDRRIPADAGRLADPSVSPRALVRG
ncbi:FAD-dependent oxidoreductase [Streptomyces sp. NPDC048002]|uniref:NAD(P)/FAD-dependent oxidoreductase n=1 Tax=Streptomyces sp. NPDC048002 TaxID=3154344 RepID=UPI0033F5E1CC